VRYARVLALAGASLLAAVAFARSRPTAVSHASVLPAVAGFADSAPAGADARGAVLPVQGATPELAEAKPLVSLGTKLFFEPLLSDPPGTSCSSCHDPARAFSGNHGSTKGVARGSRLGHFARRDTPSVLYLAYVPRFHYWQEEDAPQPSAFGGFFWDGRSDSIAELVKQPLTNPNEMNNRDAGAIAGRLRAGDYAGDFQRTLGISLDDAEVAVDGLGRALEAYLTSAEMAPFSSKYDAYVRGQAVFTPIEERGLKLFRNPDKGNCASCHVLTLTSPTPSRSMFTDYGYDAVAVPRNRQLFAADGRDASKFDLGLCERTDKRLPSSDEKWCSSFRTPSLRNVAVREAFMHNGAFTKLRDVVAFYATRATDPMHWYKSGTKFDDVPAKFRGQVNVNSIPYNRRAGDVPALDDGEIDAIVAFLGTLTDAAFVDRVR
jgi:cytochrome c peroxidase